MKFDNRIFLASSITEFKELRNQIQDWFVKFLTITQKKSYYVKFNMSSSFSESITKDGTQKKYNNLIIWSDLFVLLVGNKIGDISKEEFNLALDNYIIKDLPNIIVLFRDGDIIDEDVNNFKAFLNGDNRGFFANENGKKRSYYYKKYDSEKFDDYNTIVLEILRHIMQKNNILLEKFEFKIKSKKLMIDGIELIDLEKNDEYIGRQSVQLKYNQIEELKKKIIKAIDSENYDDVDILTAENKKIFSELEVLNEAIFNNIFSNNDLQMSNYNLDYFIKKSENYANMDNFYEAAILLSHNNLSKVAINYNDLSDIDDLVMALLQGIVYFTQTDKKLKSDYIFDNYKYASDVEIKYGSKKFIACNKYLDYLYNNDEYNKMEEVTYKLLNIMDSAELSKSVISIKEKIGIYYITCLDKTQEGIDILLNVYEYYKKYNNSNDIYRITYQLGRGYNSLNNLKEANRYLNLAYNLYDEVIPTLSNVIIKMNICLEMGIYYEYLNDSNMSIKILSEGITIANDNEYKENESFSSALARLYYHRGFIYYDKINDYDKVYLDLEDKALNIVLNLYKEDSKKNKKLLSDIYFSLGSYYAYMQNSEKAHSYHTKSIKLREGLYNDAKNVHAHDLAKNYFYYAAFLGSNHSFVKSMEYHKKAYDIYKYLLKQNFYSHAKNMVFSIHFHSSLYLVMIDNNIFKTLEEKEMWLQKVEQLLIEGLTISEELYKENQSTISDYYASLCNSFTHYHLIIQNFDEAIKWAKKAIYLRNQEIEKNPNCEIHKLAEDYLILGESYGLSNSSVDNINKSIESLNKCKNILLPLLQTQKESRAYNLARSEYELAKMYIKIGDLVSAKENVYSAIELFEYLQENNENYIHDEITKCRKIIDEYFK